MKFAVAALLGVTSAALSEKQLIHNQLVALSGMVSEFDAPEKDAIFNRIAERKDELANQLLAHPEHTESILSEVATLKGLVRSVDAQNYDAAMNLMEARKEQLKSQLVSLVYEKIDPATIKFPENVTEANKADLAKKLEATKADLDAAKTKAEKALVDAQAIEDEAKKAEAVTAADKEVATAVAKLLKYKADAAYFKLDEAKRLKVKTAYDAWVAAYKVWKEETDTAKKADALTKLDTAMEALKTEFPEIAPGDSTVNGEPPSGGSTVFIVIGVVLVLAAAVGGGLWYKNKSGKSNSEGGEADDRKLYKSQIASVNAHKKAQKVALVDADV